MAYRLGIVLSGGGARAVAHIGVLKALTERGLSADCIAGASSGALVGALYAAGYADDEMLAFFHDKKPFKLSLLSVGKPGFIDTAKIRAGFLDYFPEDSFSALSRKLFVTATDIVNGRPAIFDSGSLISAILASSSVPMVFTPTERDGRWYLDGGILNNFPVEPLLGTCDVIVGCYATSIRPIHREELTSSLSVLERSLEVGIYYNSRSKFHSCDVMIQPPGLASFGTFETRHLEEIADIGYQAALKQIGEIEDALASVE